MKNNDVNRMQQSQAAKSENLSKWRKSKLHETTLPSGLDVVLRDVDLTDIVFNGNIPNTLIDVIGDESFKTMSDEEASKKLLGEHKSDFSMLLEAMVRASLVEPSIGDVADEEHITYDELGFADKMFIFNFMNREAGEVRSFREGSVESREPA